MQPTHAPEHLRTVMLCAAAGALVLYLIGDWWMRRSGR